MNRSILNYIEDLIRDDDYQKNISDRSIEFSRRAKSSIDEEKNGATADSHQVGYMSWLDDVDVCLSIYSIIH